MTADRPHQPDQAILVDQAIDLVADWVTRATDGSTSRERQAAGQLHGVIDDPDGVAFAMRFVDRVIRPEDPRVAAAQLRGLVSDQPLPGFLSAVDRVLLRAGAQVGRALPQVVTPLAVRRMRQLVGHLVVDAEPSAMDRHLATRRDEGFRLNVNLLGEAVLGRTEAQRRWDAAEALLAQPHVDYVSVKVSAIVAQLNPWDHDGNVTRVADALRPLLLRARATEPPTFVNLDMEEYHDLDLTVAAFTLLLDEPALHDVDAGIVLQAYLPDSYPALQHLVAWANARRARTIDGRAGGTIKIRLVKGANLAMERVDAAIHGWPQAPYATKAETDANYKRCVDWLLQPERMHGVRLGLASHNLFDVAWGRLVSLERQVGDRVEFEMLQGMAPAQARVVRDAAHPSSVLLYTPAVGLDEFDVAISYLFRRLEENASDENFIRHLFTLSPGSPDFDVEADKFRSSVHQRHNVSATPRRTQDRRQPAPSIDLNADFVNEADTDPTLEANRVWASEVLHQSDVRPHAALAADTATVDAAVRRAREAQPAWAARPADERRQVLHRIGHELSRRRGDLVAAMVHEGAKTIGEADPEVSEAIDFARWYGDRAPELAATTSARFDPLGVVVVVPPWNFPVAIPAGGMLAALAAGNTVVLKPAPETPRGAEIVAECAAVAGVADAVQFLRTPDDEVGRHLIAHDEVDAVILTGAFETAALFRNWAPELRIFAETSGKNSLIITPNADIDLAVADLVASAFGHAGQKCSAASLAICVGDVYQSGRFRRQLVDAVRSLAVGPASEAATAVNPVIREPEDKLERALTVLDHGEEWLVKPHRLDGRTWSPGVRLGVNAGAWFHQTECFGPVLGVMRARDLDHAIELQNGNSFGLTGGLHTLDGHEIDHWLERVEVGNAYVNRPITGAIVARQPFGGWKRSVVGPGAKAGGPNYVAQLGRWSPTDADLDDTRWLDAADASDHAAWRDHFSVEHDPIGLFCEANIFRYRSRPRVGIRVETGSTEREVVRVVAAARRCGVEIDISRADQESATDYAERLASAGVDRVRLVGSTPAIIRETAFDLGIHVADDAVTTEGRIELQHYLREQSISRTMHRYGNLL